jgi:hypothetical protein
MQAFVGTIALVTPSLQSPARRLREPSPLLPVDRPIGKKGW